MDLSELHDHLSICPEDTEVIIVDGTYIGSTIGSIHSYRGDYEQIAFEPANGTKNAGELLKEINDTLFTHLEGWKGGDYFVGGDEEVYISYEGSASSIALHRAVFNGRVLCLHTMDLDY